MRARVRVVDRESVEFFRLLANSAESLRAFRRSLAMSVTFHGALLAALVVLSRQAASWQTVVSKAEPKDRAVLYFSLRTPKVMLLAQQKPTVSAGGGAPGPATPRPPAPPTTARVNVERVTPKPPVEQVILTMQEAPIVDPPPLPNLVLWAKQPEVPRPFVAPAPRQAPATPPKTITTVVPDLSASVASAQAVPKLSSDPLKALPRMAQPAPVRMITETVKDVQVVSSIPAGGLPFNVVLINATPPPAQQTLAVPAGTADGRIAAAAPAGAGKGTAGGGGGSGTGVGAGAGAGAGAGSAPPRAANGLPIEIVHPDRREHDAIIISSGSGEGSGRGALSGQPVYSIYLNVGVAKRWILQYAVAENKVKRMGAIIQLPSASPVKPPYPRKTVIPWPELIRSETSTVIRGLLSTTGQLKQLSMLSGEAARLTDVLFPFLERWEFRPAVRDGQPVEVEVLLSIPPLGK